MKKRHGYHHGDLRRALIDGALKIIEKEGEEACTLREVARRVGVSQAAPYRHFADKDALIAAVAEEGHRLLQESMREAAAPHTHSEVARFRELGIAYVEFAVAHPAHFHVMFGPICGTLGEHPSLAAEGARSFMILLDAVADCQRKKVVRGDDPQEIAQFAWTVVHGLASLLVDGQLPPQPLRPLATRILKLAFEGMGK
jgi:AcrR family transcriptional regulator